MNEPLRFSPSFEQPEAGEAETNEKLKETFLGISNKTFADTGHGFRGAHAKSHALLQGMLQVADDLSPALAQGLFAQAGSYPVILRFSTTPGDILPDSVSTPRGLAIKIVGVAGDRLPGSAGDVTQDFVMVNAPTFQNKNAARFLTTVKPLAAMTDKAEGLKKVVSATMRTVERGIEALRSDAGLVRNTGGEVPRHPLGEQYFTQVPHLHGDYFGKFSLAPVSAALQALTGTEIEITESPTAIREAMVDFFKTHGGEWDLRVQLCTDLDAMPVEQADVEWPQTDSPYVTVGRITVAPQAAWTEALSVAIDDSLSFSPWHGLAAHRPIGSVMRVRKAAYEAVSAARLARNGKPVREPTSLADIFQS